jgi:hypothetical protein
MDSEFARKLMHKKPIQWIWIVFMYTKCRFCNRKYFLCPFLPCILGLVKVKLDKV